MLSTVCFRQFLTMQHSPLPCKRGFASGYPPVSRIPTQLCMDRNSNHFDTGREIPSLGNVLKRAEAIDTARAQSALPCLDAVLSCFPLHICLLKMPESELQLPRRVLATPVPASQKPSKSVLDSIALVSLLFGGFCLLSPLIVPHYFVNIYTYVCTVAILYTD